MKQRRSLPPEHHWIVRVTVVLYAGLLRLSPAELRRDYGDVILEAFEQMCRSAWQQEGISGVLRLWPLALTDVCSGVLAEYYQLLHQRMLAMTKMRSVVPTLLYTFTVFVLASLCFRLVAAGAGPDARPKGLTAGVMIISMPVVVLTLAIGGLPLLAAGAAALRRGAYRSQPPSPRPYRFALVSATVGVVAMVLASGAALVWGAGLLLRYPAELSSPHGFLSTPLFISWLGTVIPMCLILAITAVTVYRGYRAYSLDLVPTRPTTS